MSPDRSGDKEVAPPSFHEAFRFWLKLGFISFGGPAGQIAIMQTELVDKRRWISQERFLHALNFCMLLPGPEAQQLAIYIGWLLHRTWGGIVAGTLFVIPSAVILWALSVVYVAYGTVPWIAAIFYGLKPAVLAIVIAAIVRLGRKALQTPLMGAVAAAAFALIFFVDVPFPAIIFGALLVGIFGRRLFKPVAHGAAAQPEDRWDAAAPGRPSWRRALVIASSGLVLWWLPILLLGAWQGWSGTLFQEGLFFSKAAMVTFGGAYAVLPYVAQQAVEHYGWLQAGQMIDGLGLAETTPGPLIMVLQFVGFLGGWHQPGGLPPLAAATLGAFITTWATFVPCFLWIFIGAPHIEQLRGNRRLNAALSAVTAAVVGVVLNLAVWFGLHVFFPAGRPPDWFAAVVSGLALLALLRWKWDVLHVIAASALMGGAYRLALTAA